MKDARETVSAAAMDAQSASTAVRNDIGSMVRFVVGIGRIVCVDRQVWCEAADVCQR
jgi:hypothetical protein